MWNFVSVLEKSAISAAYTGLASAFTTGASFRVPFMGQALPLYLFTGLAGAISSVAIDGIHYLVKNEVSINKKAQDEASLYLGAIVGGGAYWAVITAYNAYLTRDMGTLTILCTGALAEVASSLTYNMIAG